MRHRTVSNPPVVWPAHASVTMANQCGLMASGTALRSVCVINITQQASGVIIRVTERSDVGESSSEIVHNTADPTLALTIVKDFLLRHTPRVR
jgi:hypothetical protein